MSDEKSINLVSDGGVVAGKNTKDKKDKKEKTKEKKVKEIEKKIVEPPPSSDDEDEDDDPPTEDDDLDDDDDEEDEEDDDESNVSFSTTDILANDPLYFVLSKIFVTEGTEDTEPVNIATILQNISTNLAKLVDIQKKAAKK